MEGIGLCGDLGVGPVLSLVPGLSLWSTPGTQQYAGGKVHCSWMEDEGPWTLV